MGDYDRPTEPAAKEAKAIIELMIADGVCDGEDFQLVQFCWGSCTYRLIAEPEVLRKFGKAYASPRRQGDGLQYRTYNSRAAGANGQIVINPKLPNLPKFKAEDFTPEELLGDLA